MLVAYPYYLGDQDLALNLAQWITEMGGCKGHKVLIVRDQGSDPEKDVLIKAELDKSFDASEVITIIGDVYHSWPMSQNLMWSQTARHIQFHTKEPWLWFESDVVILKEKWLDLIEAEYKACGKIFMGDLVNVSGIPPHMSGVAVWPGEVVQYAGIALISHEVAFDMAAKDQVLPQMHKTELIAHAWDRDLATGKGNRVFENYEQVEREVLQPHPGAVIYHADKSGSLIKLLRERRVAKLEDARLHSVERPLETRRDVQNLEKPREGSNPSSPTCDIFIKTYPKDYEWLSYCLRSTEKFTSGFRKQLIITSGQGNLGFATHPDGDVVIHKSEYGENGYLSQEVFKLKADEFTEADFILYMDSDTQFIRPVTAETFFKDGKILWMITPYSGTKAPWKPITEKFLKMPVEYETMRRHPIVVPRWLLKEVREFCQKTHGISIEEYVMSQPGHEFSEFNVLGAYAYHFHRDKFHWVDTSKIPENEWPVLTVNQEWSHNPLDDAMKAKLETILNGTTDSPEKTEAICSPGIETDRTVHSSSETLTPSELATLETSDDWPPKHPRENTLYKNHEGLMLFKSGKWKRVILESVTEDRPWEDKQSSMDVINDLAERLSAYCSAPVYKGRVRQVLREKKIIK